MGAIQLALAAIFGYAIKTSLMVITGSIQMVAATRMPFKSSVKCRTRAPLVSSLLKTALNRAAGRKRLPALGSPSTRRDSRSTTTLPIHSSSSCVYYHRRLLSDSFTSALRQLVGSMRSAATMTRLSNSRPTTMTSSVTHQMNNDSLFKTLARLVTRTDVLKLISILATLTFFQLRTSEHLILATRAKSSVSQSSQFVSMVKMRKAPDKTILNMGTGSATLFISS